MHPLHNRADTQEKELNKKLWSFAHLQLHASCTGDTHLAVSSMIHASCPSFVTLNTWHQLTRLPSNACCGPVISLMWSLDPSLSTSWQHAHGWSIINSSQPITKDEKSSWSSCMPHHHFHVYIMHKGKDRVILGIKLTCILPPVGWHFERAAVDYLITRPSHAQISKRLPPFWSRSTDSVVRSQRFPELCIKAWTFKFL